LGVPTVSDRALQRSTAQVLSAIYEQDFLPCSFGGRPGRGTHHALATLNEVIAGSKIGWVLEADLKNFFGGLSHEWLLRFVEHRVGDPRLISLIRRWLKAGVLEDGEVHPNEEGTPQGGSISVLLSNVYLHYVLDLRFERVAKPRLRGEAYLVRYIDDFVVCCQYRLQEVLRQKAKTNEGVFIPSRARGADYSPMCKTALAFTIQQPETACHLLTTRGPSCTMDCGSSKIEEGLQAHCKNQPSAHGQLAGISKLNPRRLGTRFTNRRCGAISPVRSVPDPPASTAPRTREGIKTSLLEERE
jgi:hypothetical protein